MKFAPDPGRGQKALHSALTCGYTPVTAQEQGQLSNSQIWPEHAKCGVSGRHAEVSVAWTATSTSLDSRPGRGAWFGIPVV